MIEPWLRPNRRALLIGCIPALVFGGAGFALFIQQSQISLAWRAVAIAMIAVSALAIVVLLLQLRRARVAYRDGHVLFDLRPGAPIAVPVEVVEAFFVGQGPAHLPGDFDNKEKTMNLVARLSQRHKEWMQQEVKPALGNWCEGYVTIRGTWCEPLDQELVRRLNRRLKEVKEAGTKTSA
jgi:hypothetical protein